MLDLLLPETGSESSQTAEDVDETPRSSWYLKAGKNPVIYHPGKAAADAARRANWTSAMWIWMLPDRSMPMVEIFSNVGMEEMGINFKDMLGGLMPKNTKRRKVKVPEAMNILTQEEAQGLVDMDKVVKEAIEKVEQSGIIFLDEIDKIVGKDGGHGPDVSREGVQRDLLPIVEGSTVTTKYGPVKTDHILFIASGAFHTSQAVGSDPGTPGPVSHPGGTRFSGQREFVRILTEPKNALLAAIYGAVENRRRRIGFRG